MQFRDIKKYIKAEYNCVFSIKSPLRKNVALNMYFVMITLFIFKLYLSTSVSLGDSGDSSGVVKMFSSNSWASICSDSWTAEASNIVCGQLGYQ